MDRPYFFKQRPPLYPSATHNRSGNTGYSLVEVLVTLLIMAFGLTGWALLLALGVSTQLDAYARTQAALAAGSLLERIRTTRRVTASDAALAEYLRPQTAQDLGACKIAGADSNNDRVCWYQLLRQRLPRGTGRITSSGEQLHIEIFWYDGRAHSDPQIDSRTKCEHPDGANRVWSDNPIVIWVPAAFAPKPAVCLQVQRWTLAL